MRSISFKIFASSLLSLIILTVVLVLFLLYGFTTSYSRFRNERLRESKEYIEKVLKENLLSVKDSRELESVIYPFLPQNSIFVFFDTDKKELFRLIKVGRGKAESLRSFKIDLTKIYPVVLSGKKFGFYAFYSLTQTQDLATERLIRSTITTFFVSLFISFVLAMIIAFVFSRNILKEVKALAYIIEKIEKNDQAKNQKKKWAREFLSIVNSVNALKERLNNEKKIREQWSSDIAHDLRTPIAALKAQLEGMYDGVLKIDKDRIKKNLIQLEKIETLVNDLSLLIKLDSPELKLNRTNVNLKDFFDYLLTNFEHIKKTKNISVDLDIPEIMINIDRTLFERAFANIVGNAFKFVNEGGTVSIKIKSISEKIRIEVFNTGSFIKEEDKDKIFERLYKIDDARNSSGTGLGLTIAKRIIELHNGLITVNSKKNYGTTFVVELQS